MIAQRELGARLADAIGRYEVPGAAIGVLCDGDIVEAAAGVVNLNTGVETTTDTLFQIGSQGKSWTAVVVMQLVDEGLLDLDTPVQGYLPGFKVSDPDVSARVSLRHLLAHTSGIDGDYFEDFGRGDDCLERYVGTCASLQQTHPLGTTMSYCNTGYVILGRIIEVVTGMVWDAAMQERLFAPLNLNHTNTLPEQAILHRVAVGHMKSGPGEPLQVAPVWMLPRVTGPAGLINSTARDVLTFAQLFIDDGRAPDGTRVLSADAVAQMKEAQVEIPDPHSLGSHWGAGLILFDWDGRRLCGHDGATIGQGSRLRILPEECLAVILVGNGPGLEEVYRELFSELFSDLAGIVVPARPELPKVAPDIDLSNYQGTYERLAVRYDLAANNGRLEGTVTLSGPLATMLPNPVQKISMLPVDAKTFLAFNQEDEPPSPAVFYEFENGVPQYLHNGVRANRRLTSAR